MVARPVYEAEVNTTRGLLDSRFNTGFLVLAGAPFPQGDGHLQAVEGGAVDRARLSELLVDVVEPAAAREVVDMTGSALCHELERKLSHYADTDGIYSSLPRP